MRPQKQNLEPVDKTVRHMMEERFAVQSETGSSRITFVRKDTAGETVRVIVDAGNPEWLEGGEEGEEDGEPQDSHVYYTMIVVNKPGKAHQVVIEAYMGPTSGVDVRNVHYAPADADLDTLGNKGQYTGPVYDELDEELRAAFDGYVVELGVDTEFASGACQYADAKEQTEYVHWLSSVKEYLN